MTDAAANAPSAAQALKIFDNCLKHSLQQLTGAPTSSLDVAFAPAHSHKCSLFLSWIYIHGLLSSGPLARRDCPGWAYQCCSRRPALDWDRHFAVQSGRRRFAQVQRSPLGALRRQPCSDCMSDGTFSFADLSAPVADQDSHRVD